MIPKVAFKFDRERDLRNIWDTCNAKPSWGYSWKNAVTKNILDLCEGRKYEKCRSELAKTMKYIHRNPISDEIVESVNSAWRKIGKEYFGRMEEIVGDPFPLKGVSAYLTTAMRFPYNYNKRTPFFFVPYFSGIPYVMQTSGHELMHIYLHNNGWWEKVEKELGNKKTHDLKEAMTVLLNLEFKDLWIVEDKGYPNHMGLRKFIEREWKKKKDFDELTDKCIRRMK